MEHKIQEMIAQFIQDYQSQEEVSTKWQMPLVAFADAGDEAFSALKEIVDPSHAMPFDLMPEAKAVVAYFIPFDQKIIKSNIAGKESSKAWARAYIETNQLIFELNTHMKKSLESMGYTSTVIPATHNFDTKKLISGWSHRHVAFIAGLGTYGLNNMLITQKGCCGRIGSFVTDIALTPTPKSTNENCLYKHNQTCKKCVERCVNEALKVDGFDRHKCYEMCLLNDEVHSDLGLCDVCGKCLVNIPCSMINPNKFKS